MNGIADGVWLLGLEAPFSVVDTPSTTDQTKSTIPIELRMERSFEGIRLVRLRRPQGSVPT